MYHDLSTTHYQSLPALAKEIRSRHHAREEYSAATHSAQCHLNITRNICQTSNLCAVTLHAWGPSLIRWHMSISSLISGLRFHVVTEMFY